MPIARRTLLAGLGTAVLAQPRFAIPVRRITDARAKVTADAIWPEAERCFAAGGMSLQVTDITG